MGPLPGNGMSKLAFQMAPAAFVKKVPDSSAMIVLLPSISEKQINDQRGNASLLRTGFSVFRPVHRRDLFEFFTPGFLDYGRLSSHLAYFSCTSLKISWLGLSP